MDALQLAHAVGESMFAADSASRDFMQMELVSCTHGRPVMRMAVREPMLNGHKICHGGLIFTLIGLALIGCVATGRALFVARDGSREALVGGIFFTACGVLLALNSRQRAGRHAPRFLDGELLADESPPPWGERVAAVCAHGMIALFLVFGLRLLREGLR